MANTILMCLVTIVGLQFIASLGMTTNKPSNIATSADDCSAMPTVPAAKSGGATRTFYRRALPESCVAFSSRNGRSIFESAMNHKGLKSFFSLMEQHTTQAEPSYCGISTLVIALNALAMDPLQTWKGPWRWYEESMLNCCVDLEKVKETGITLKVFNCLAVCQGLDTDLIHVDDKTDVESFRTAISEACLERPPPGGEGDNDDTTIDRVIVVSYSRKVLQQTGSGHFSPIAAFDPESDSVLIMDTARFKYGSHWVKLPLLFDAMHPVDPDTGRSRGYVTLIHRSQQRKENTVSSSTALPVAVLFQSEMQQSTARQAFKKFMETPEKSGIRPNFSDVVHFLTKGGTDPKFAWTLTYPQSKPSDSDIAMKEFVQEVRTLIQAVLTTLDSGTDVSMTDRTCNSNVSCRPNFCRTLPLHPEEAICAIYLSCLDDSTRRSIIFSPQIENFSTARAREQLCNEAKLIRFAIDASDELQSF